MGRSSRIVSAQSVAGRLATATALLALAACGNVGPKVIPPFIGGVIGPAGGHLAAGQVDLSIPPGALTQDVVIQIFPQPEPLPLDPAAPPIVIMQLMCIGPVGHGLNLPATVKFCYDSALIPVGSTVGDVVLLEWDENQGFLVVIGGVTHDQVAHCFTHTTYGELGHIGVGAVAGLVRDLVFAANPLQSVAVVPGVAAFPPTGLILASSTGPALPQGLLNTDGAEGYVASRDATKVIWRRSDPNTETTQLLSSETADSTQHVLIQPGDEFEHGDPLYGSISASRVYTARNRFVEETSHDTVLDVGVTGVPASSNLYSGQSAFGRLIDVRVSPDETMLMLRYRDTAKGTFDALFIIDSTTGAEIGTFLPGVDDIDAATPRWLPNSSGYYFVALDGQSVERHNTDGGGLATLYAMPAQPNAFIQDFVVAPSFGSGPNGSTPCAYFKSTFSPVVDGIQAIVIGGNDSFFVRDVLGGGALASHDLGMRVDILELIYHPDGTNVIAQVLDQNRVSIVLESPETVRIYDATTAAELHTFNSTLEHFDVDRTSGEIVVWFPTGLEDPNFTTSGLYRLASNGDTLGPINLNGIVPTGPARYLRSWRRTPGQSASFIR